MKNNRRDFIKKSAGMAAAAAVSVSGLTGCSGAGSNKAPKNVKWPVIEGPNTPKLCVGLDSVRNSTTEEVMKDIKQMGVDYVLTGGPRTPWTVEDLRSIMDNFKAHGLTVINMMISGNSNCIHGKEGRDEEIEKIKESIIAAGIVGLPVIEYNFYVDRLNEGYYYKEGRGGSGVTAFDYAPVKDLPTRPGIEKFTAEQIWDNLTYFLKAIIPTAEKAGVRMALHPNDPPPAISKGNPQIMATFNDWKRLLDIVKSPANGMTFDPGVCWEMGVDPIEVMRYMGSRDQMNHSHYRNVITHEPYNKYEEVFFDVGEVNMFAVMQEYFNIGYNLYIYPEHPRFFTRDKQAPGYTEGAGERIGGYPGGGGTSGEIFNVAYTRAMMQAAMSV